MSLEVGRATISGLWIGVSDSLAFLPHDCKVAAIDKSLMILYIYIHIQGNESRCLFCVPLRFYQRRKIFPSKAYL